MERQARKRKPRVTREKATAYKTKPVPTLTRAEAKAIEEFRARLKEILPPGALKSLILYGSKARGEARPGSDVDLLVVRAPVSAQQEEKLDELLWQLGFGFNIKPYLEISILPAEHVEYLENIGTPYIQNVARDGIVLEGEPVVVKQINKREVARKNLERADRALSSAKLMMQDGDYPGSVSKAYFIFLDAADAGLVTKGLVPQSHAGTIKLFNLHFVKPGLVPEKFGHLFGKMEKDRIDADYKKEIEWTKEDAERSIARSQELLEIMERLVSQLLEEDQQ